MIPLGLISQQSSSEPPGRVFNVGSGSGTLTINGASLGGGLIETDTVIVNAGTYSSITVQNIDIPSGKATIDQSAAIYSGQMNIQNVVGVDFKNGNFVDCPNRAIEFVPGTLGNISILDTIFTNVSDYTIVYPAMSFSGTFNGLRIAGCNFDDCTGVLLQGNVNFGTSVDNGRVDDLVFENNHFENCDTTQFLKADNANNYIVRNCTALNCTDSSTSHARLFHVAGEGIMYNLKCENYYGQIATQWPFSRYTAGNGYCAMWNIIGRNCGRYSITEVQNFDNLLEAGVSSPCDVVIGHITAIDLTGFPGVFPATCADLYTQTFAGRNTVSVFNSVTVNTDLPEGNEFRGYHFVINNISQDWDNVIYDCNLPYNASNPSQHGSFPTDVNPYETYEDIGLDGVVYYRPVISSVLIGAGQLIEGMELDYYGVERSATPSIGACEPE